MLGAGSRRATRCAHCVRCNRTGAASMSTKRAVRADPAPGLAGRAGPCGPAVRESRAVPRTTCVRAHLLASPEIAPAGGRLPRRHHGGLRTDMPASLSAQSRRGTDMRFIELQFSSGVPEPPLNSGADTGPGTSPRCFRFMSLAGGSPHALWSRPPPHPQRCARAGRSAPARRRGTQGSWPRASARFGVILGAPVRAQRTQ